MLEVDWALELSLCASSRSAGSENLHTGHGRQFSPFTNCRVHWLQAGLCLQRPHTYMLRRSTSKQTGHLLSRTHAPGWPNLELLINQYRRRSINRVCSVCTPGLSVAEFTYYNNTLSPKNSGDAAVSKYRL